MRCCIQRCRPGPIPMPSSVTATAWITRGSIEAAAAGSRATAAGRQSPRQPADRPAGGCRAPSSLPPSTRRCMTSALGSATKARPRDARHFRMGGASLPRFGNQGAHAHPSRRVSRPVRGQCAIERDPRALARDAAEHNKIVHGILRDHGATSLIKSKSMLTEECGFRHYMASVGIEVIETDLGERIQQLDNEIQATRGARRAQAAHRCGRSILTYDRHHPDNTDVHYLAEAQRERPAR